MPRGLRWVLARDDVLLAVILALALLCSLPLLWARAAEERANLSLDLTMDLDELEEVARSWGRPLGEVLVELRACGLTSLAVEEVNLKRLAAEGEVTVLTGAELSALGQAGADLPPLALRLLDEGQIRPGCTYALTADAGVFQRILTGARRHLPQQSYWSWSQEGFYVCGLAGRPQELEKMGLGIWERDLRLARDAGLAVVVRPLNWPGITGEEVREFFSSLDGFTVSAVAFAGYEALGYPDHLDGVAREMVRRGWPLGMVEAPVQRGYILQRGTEDLARLMDYRVVRVYAIARKELDKLKLGEAVDRWLRGAKERNIRVLYLRPLLEGEARGRELPATSEYVSEVARELRLSGFSFGLPRPFAPLGVRLRYAWLMAWGVAAGALLLVRRLGPLSRAPTWGLFGAGVLGWLGLRLLGVDLLLRQATALLAAMVFPSLAVAWVVGRSRRLIGREAGGDAGPDGGAGPTGAPAGGREGLGRTGFSRGGLRLWGEGILAVAGATAVTLAGAALVGALLGDVRFMLELDYFRGVKLSYVVPPVLAVAAYAARFDLTPDGREGRGWGRYWRQAGIVLRQPLLVVHLLLLLILAALGVLYLGRAGHEAGIPVMPLEVQARAFLEHTLWARPRMKEFLLGHPALMLAPLFLFRGPRSLLPLVFLLAGVGQVSVINSFEHLRTPFLVSLLRSGHGAWLGVLIGAAALGLGELAWRWRLKAAPAAAAASAPPAGAAEEAAAGPENPILPDPAEMIFGTLAFLIVFGVLARYAFPALNRILAERAARIQGEMERAEAARTEADRVLAEYREQLAGAREEANRIIEEARRTAEQLRRDLQAKAEQEAQATVARAQEEIRAERDRVFDELRAQVADIAVELAGRVVGQALDRAAHER
ncbi:MAG: F0F1 ATP synthase subunit B, partial [Acetobacteraceae bacterium]|nr:F0F1 ATP synthase subunit B [Acetobacteraceae bacterium]